MLKYTEMQSMSSWKQRFDRISCYWLTDLVADTTKLADFHHGVIAKHLHQSNLQNAYKQPILPKLLFLLICINTCNKGNINLLSIIDTV